jgi:hypothetical protein
MPRRVIAMVAIVCCLLIAGCGEPKAGPPAAYQTPTARAAARIVATHRIDSRTRDITIDSPAVGKSGQGAVALACELRGDEPPLAGALPAARLL